MRIRLRSASLWAALLAAAAIGASAWLAMRTLAPDAHRGDPDPAQSALARDPPSPATAPPPSANDLIAQLRPDAGTRGIRASPDAVPETVDSVLKSLLAGNVAFNVPSNMRLARTQTLEARLGVDVPLAQLTQEVAAEGEVRSAQLRVSPRMQATLSGGAAFDVSPSGPQVQFVSNEESNIWQWEVTPKLEGQQVLVLTFGVFIEVGGKEGVRTVNTLRQLVTVEVGWPQTARGWAEWLKRWVEYGGWLWTAVLLPVGVLILREWRKHRAKPALNMVRVDDPDGGARLGDH